MLLGVSTLNHIRIILDKCFVAFAVGSLPGVQENELPLIVTLRAIGCIRIICMRSYGFRRVLGLKRVTLTSVVWERRQRL